MATLALSTVGTALAGPIGGMLGSLVGQSIDQQLMGGGPRKGPRLGDLGVQTSSYGTPIPRIYGTMRVAGTIVWATDLREDSDLQGDGKSQPETAVYTYSVSFAVALSSRHASGVKRIWADGKLIRGAAGDMKVPCKFRFYPGTEGQEVDPLIETEEGIGQAPAYRGLALAVFEDLQLADFGNRIPAITFEMEGDGDTGIVIGDLLNDAAGGAVDCSDERLIGGYATYGADIGSAIAPLVEAFAVDLVDEGDAFRSPSNDDVFLIAEEVLGASAEISPAAKFEREQAAAASMPSSLTLTYYEPARDYQTGQARVSTPAPSRVARAVSLPCALDAGTAKGTAENLLLRAWALRERITVRLVPEHLDVRPGAVFRLPGVVGDWTAEDVEIERFVVTVTLRPSWSGSGIRTADPGRPADQPDVVAAPTRLALFDLPDPATAQPTLMLAAASPSGSWRSVPVEISAGGSNSGGRTAVSEAVLGTALTVLATGQAFLMDEVCTVDVQLANPDHWLESRDEQALAMGANVAMIGSELIQFGAVEPIGAGRFRLSRLLRGRGGSEWAMASHEPGEIFVLVEQRSLKPIAVPLAMLGSIVSVTAHGIGDVSAPPSVSIAANGESMRPLSPAHLAAAYDGAGELSISWVRRSRLAWSWQDEIEEPIDGEDHGFRVKLIGVGTLIERDVAEPSATFDAAELAILGAGPLSIEVRQIGSIALSRPAILNISA